MLDRDGDGVDESVAIIGTSTMSIRFNISDPNASDSTFAFVLTVSAVEFEVVVDSRFVVAQQEDTEIGKKHPFATTENHGI